ncbi:HD domain-containing protein [Sunxiuqinia sp. sy24]|uniref:HD domain-containing protein n=1 Tax=Sunxiuqinia sp. sy24 TaxID=3461495 RepID=UPI004045CC5D
MEELSFLKQNSIAASDFFEKYTAGFLRHEDQEVADLLTLKREHSLRVAKLSGLVATNLMLEEEDILLAEVIGLLHDLGRFEQFEKHQSFNDQQAGDHAELGVALLKEQAFFTAFSEERQNLIAQAILNHNKESISLKEDKLVVTYSQILRDADKLDIWETCVNNLKRDGNFKYPSISLNLPATGLVNDKIIRSIQNQKQAKRKDMQSVNDFKLMLMSMIFDLNFRVSFQLLSEKQSIKQLYESMSKKDVVIDAYRELRLFIENKFVV